jgi:hypothetical protein
MSWRYNWVIRIRISKKNRHHNVFKISKGWSGSVNRRRTDNTMSWRYNWVIRIRISKKNRHHNVLKISKGWSGSVNRRRTDIIMSWRYQRGDQDPSIEEEQTSQCLEDIKEVIRFRKSKKNRHHNVFNISKGWSGSVNRRRTDNTMSWR